MKAYCWSGGIAPHILDLSTRWKWVASFMSLLLFPPWKEPLVPTGQEDGWAPKPVWTQWCREKFPAPVRTWTPNRPASSPMLYHWAILANYLLVCTFVIVSVPIFILTNCCLITLKCERLRSWPILRYHQGILLDDLENTTDIIQI
jgi:hypothetical protein